MSVIKSTLLMGIAAIFILCVGWCAASAATPHPQCWGEKGDIRASFPKYHFFKNHPCPGGPDKGSVRRCRGYVIDHICPLECCGKDDPSNMQWQTIEDAKTKDRWESTCQTCKGHR